MQKKPKKSRHLFEKNHFFKESQARMANFSEKIFIFFKNRSNSIIFDRVTPLKFLKFTASKLNWHKHCICMQMDFFEDRNLNEFSFLSVDRFHAFSLEIDVEV